MIVHSERGDGQGHAWHSNGVHQVSEVQSKGSKAGPRHSVFPLLPRSVRISALALLKMAMHARSGGELEVGNLRVCVYVVCVCVCVYMCVCVCCGGQPAPLLAHRAASHGAANSQQHATRSLLLSACPCCCCR